MKTLDLFSASCSLSPVGVMSGIPWDIDSIDVAVGASEQPDDHGLDGKLEVESPLHDEPLLERFGVATV